MKKESDELLKQRVEILELQCKIYSTIYGYEFEDEMYINPIMFPREMNFWSDAEKRKFYCSTPAYKEREKEQLKKAELLLGELEKEIKKYEEMKRHNNGN